MGAYLPRRVVHSEELDKKLGLKPGTLEGLAGVKTRRYASEDETNSQMGAFAAMAALEKAGLKYDDIDVIINASGTYEQPIPSTAALIQKALGKEESGVPSFDVNSTCLGFVVGLDTAASLIQSGRYKRVLLVSTDIASVGLPWHQHEACALFGDGAVAAVLEPTPAGEKSTILGARQETYSSGADSCEIVGGGTRIHPRNIEFGHDDDKRFLFKMDGRRVFKQASQRLPNFMEHLEKQTQLKTTDYKMVVPHQASASAMELLRRKLDIKPENFMSVISEYGNMIAASIPLALYKAIEEKRIERGDRVMLIGTSAGFSIGAVSFIY